MSASAKVLSIERENAPEAICRLNLKLPKSRYDKLQSLSAKTGMNMTTVVRCALSLIEVAVETRENGGRLVVQGGKSGAPQTEILLPF